MRRFRYVLTASAFFLVFNGVGFCSASLAYLTPTGSATGNCLAGTATSPNFTPSQFNATANWGSAAGQIGPGTTILLCGTFTGTAGSTELTFQGSGTSGSQITLLFDTNAELNAPYWAASPNGGCGGAICMYNKSYIAVDGGGTGIIQNTANGDSLAYQKSSEAIEAMKCNNCTIQNLTLANIYVHTSGGNSSIDQTTMRCITFTGSNWSVTNNTMHDAGWCLYENYGNGDGNVSINKNTIYNIDHGWMLATQTAGGSSGPFSFYGNHVYGYANWDTSSDSYHHDGIHCFTSGTSGTPAHITALSIYNNMFQGPVGTDITAHIFLEGGTGSGSTPCDDASSSNLVYNNIFSADEPINNGLAGLFSGNVSVYNNTFMGSGTASGICFGSGSDVSAVTFENNAVTGCNQLLSINAPFTANYNAYGNGGSNAFVCSGNYYSMNQFTQWKSCIAGDAQSTYSASLNLNSSGVPQTGSPAATAGINLSSLGITALNYDTSAGNTRTPSLRPSSWPAGAYDPSTPYPGAPLTNTPNP